jgi:hypothetical protein
VLQGQCVDMPKCKKKACNAYRLSDDSYCLFHSNKKKRSISKKPVRLERTEDQESRIISGLTFLFTTKEGRDLLGTEVRRALIQKGMIIPIGFGLQLVSWNYPGYFHQRVYDKIARGIWWAWITWAQKAGVAPSFFVPERRVFMAMVDDYIAARYLKTNRFERAIIGGSARLASKALLVVSVIDLLYTTGRISDAAFDTGIQTYLDNRMNYGSVKPGVQALGKATYLETLVRSGEYRV